MRTFDIEVKRIADALTLSAVSFGQGTDNARDEAAWLIIGALDLHPDQVSADMVLSTTQCETVAHLLEHRVRSRRPLAYLLGECWFAGIKFQVDERVIIPRSYFSEWVWDGFAPWVDADKVERILDLCTGSGCLAITAAMAFPDAEVIATDISEGALRVAAANVQRHRLQDRIKLIQGDGFEPIRGGFDLILCNPPYVSTSRYRRMPAEFRCEPSIAFMGGKDGLDFIRMLLARAADHLTDSGMLLVESGSASPDLQVACPSVPFNWLATHYDEMVIFALTRNALITCF